MNRILDKLSTKLHFLYSTFNILYMLKTSLLMTWTSWSSKGPITTKGNVLRSKNWETNCCTTVVPALYNCGRRLLRVLAAWKLDAGLLKPLSASRSWRPAPAKSAQFPIFKRFGGLSTRKTDTTHRNVPFSTTISRCLGVLSIKFRKNLDKLTDLRHSA